MPSPFRPCLPTNRLLPSWLLHVDAAFIAVDKPAGLLAVPGRGADKADCMAARVQAQFPEARVVHRLDMGTSGVMIFARDLASQQALGRAFENRQMEKRYVAVVAGLVDGDSGSIDLPLICDWPNRPRQMVDRVRGKSAWTDWRVISRDETRLTTRLLLAPQTGRSHQLRVHLQALGHPILGDDLYAPAEICAQSSRLLLHAAQLGGPHPHGGGDFVVESSVTF